ncbi:hypothetical protein ACERII_24265 [Evansella sp. AB-rgal1]|uniref:hypothetical protein n=1 Tax=Evansella sp. AB-rgal1 TaxID=3242696 RepID=UPI00359DF649
MKYWKIAMFSLVTFVFLAGCGTGDMDEPTGDAGRSGDRAPDSGASDADADFDAIRDVEDLRPFLTKHDIAHGDFYLDGNRLVINLVDGTDEIKEFIEAHWEVAYELDFAGVQFTHEELEGAQELLNEHNLYKEANIYSSWIDVMKNKLFITLPSSSQDKVEEIEELIDPEMLTIEIQDLGEEPDIVGAIVKIDHELERILIENEIWFSFDEYSEIVNQGGEALDFDVFEDGMSVEAWHTGAVLHSYPAQGTARKIVVLN